MYSAKTYFLCILLIWLSACAHADNFGSDISERKDARDRVEEYRQVIRQMLSEGSLLSDSDRFSDTEIFKKNVYLEPCDDSQSGLSQSFTAWDFSELKSQVIYYDSAKDRYTLSTNDESIATKVRAYFERHVAYSGERARAELLKAGYPTSVFDEALEKMISDALLSDKYPADPWRAISYDHLLAKVQQYQDAHTVLPEPHHGNGCGDGGRNAIIKPVPQAARVWLISEFDYRLCEKRGHDPNNRDLCAWREVTGASFSVLGGTYRIYAKWDDGRTSIGRRNISQTAGTAASDSVDENDTYAIVVRP